MNENDNAIIFTRFSRLDGISAFVRRRCDICAGETDREAIICETPEPDDGRIAAVCQDCLQSCNIDERLPCRRSSPPSPPPC
jgi:hypothetical protein